MSAETNTGKRCASDEDSFWFTSIGSSSMHVMDLSSYDDGGHASLAPKRAFVEIDFVPPTSDVVLYAGFFVDEATARSGFSATNSDGTSSLAAANGTCPQIIYAGNRRLDVPPYHKFLGIILSAGSGGIASVWKSDL